MYNFYYPPGYPLCGEPPPIRYPKLTPSYPVPPMPYVVSGQPVGNGQTNGARSWALPAGIVAAGAIGLASYGLFFAKGKGSKRAAQTVSGDMSDLIEDEDLEDFELEEDLPPGFARDID